jgi:hypothetical protein
VGGSSPSQSPSRTLWIILSRPLQEFMARILGSIEDVFGISWLDCVIGGVWRGV